MVFARTSKAAARLGEQIRNRTVKKTYYAVLRGDVPESSGRLVNTVIKDKGANMVKVLPAEDQNAGNVAVLDFIKRECLEGHTLVEIDLITGRPHQIRAQFAYRGYPVLGDRKYGRPAPNDSRFSNPAPSCFIAGGSDLRENEIKWPALWAYKIEFDHPVSKERMSLVANAPEYPPWDRFALTRRNQGNLLR